VFGDHTLEEAKRIAVAKSLELGQRCIVVASDDAPGLYTIGVPVKSLSGADFIKQLKERIRKANEDGGSNEG